MAIFTPKFVDLVRNYTTVEGSGPVVPGGVVSGFAGFAEAVALGDRFYYCVQGIDKPAEREVGRGTMLADGSIAREPISGGLVEFTKGTKTIALVTAAEWFSKVEQGGGGSGAVSVPSRAAMANAVHAPGASLLLTEAGREGLFLFDAADLSAEVASDPAQAILVAPVSDPSGASGAWVRQYSGAADALWFGAKGDGASDDHGALQAWLDHGGELFLPARHFYSSQTLIVRRNVNVSGAGFGFDATVFGYADMPGSRIRFPVAVAGFDVQPQTSITDIATVLADPTAAFTQEGANGSIFRDFALIGGNDGAVADGFHSRAVVHCENVHSIWFMGDGFHLSATSDMPNASDEYGNASGSTFVNCVSIANAGHGFHLRGRDANACLLSACNARTNGMWGILDESLLGNSYVQPHVAGNFGGAIKAVGAVAASAFIQPYIEGDIHSDCEIAGGNVVIGRDIDAINTPPDVPPAIVSGTTTRLNQVEFNWGWDSPGAIAGRCLAFRSVLGGLTFQGQGGNDDVTMLNKTGSVALRLPTGTTNVRVEGSMSAESITTRNGFILRADNNAVLYAPVGGDTFFYSPSSGVYRFNDLANTPHTSVDNAGNWNYSGGVNLGAGKAITVGGAQVAGARKTGWAAATGTATRASFDTSTVTLPQLAERLKALIDDLHSGTGHGLIGA
jgi:hypothetical protein